MGTTDPPQAPFDSNNDLHGPLHQSDEREGVGSPINNEETGEELTEMNKPLRTESPSNSDVL